MLNVISRLAFLENAEETERTVCDFADMMRYLLENGVPAGKILREERATSTRENFMFSIGLLEANTTDCDRVAFVSNDYHIYRAALIARTAGLETVTHTHNATPWYTVVPSGLRECLAVVKAWIFS